MEWLIAIAVFLGLIALLPRVLRRSKAEMRRSGSTVSPVGLFIMSMFDARGAEVIEEARRMEELGERQDETAEKLD